MTKEQKTNFPLPTFTIRQLLEAGVHFGHKTMRRNPKMSKYIYTNRNNISIINLNKTAVLLNDSLAVVKDVAKNNGKILFVATKKQACDVVADAAKRCGQYYVNFRWLGGMLTNWKTVSQSIKTLKKIEEQLADNEIGYNKKEKLDLERKRLKLEKTLGGIKDMNGYPDLVFIVDINKESIALLESVTLNIPVMAIVDTNCNTDNVTFPIPGNDDSTKSIKLFSRLISDAAIAGFKENLAKSGVDISKLQGDYSDTVQSINSSKESIDKDKILGKAKATKANDKEDKEEPKEAKRAKKEIIKKSADEPAVAEAIKEDATKAESEKKAPAKKAATKKPAAKKSESSKEKTAAKPKAAKKAPAKKS